MKGIDEKTMTEVTAWHLVRGARQHGLDIQPDSSGSWDTPPAFESRITVRQTIELWESLFEKREDESLPFELGQIPHDHEHSLIAFLCATQPTFGDALSTLVRYWPTVTDAYDWTLRHSSSHSSLVAAPPGPVERRGWRAIVHYDIADIVSAAPRLTDGAVRARRVELAHHLDCNEEAARMLGCPIEVNCAATAVVFDSDVQKVPLGPTRPGLRSLLVRQADELLEEYVSQQTTARRARRLLGELLTRGRPTLEEVAQGLAMSERTLHRRLAHEGTSFRALLAEVRTQLAKQWLTTQTVAQVADRLAFASPRSFRRAFKRETGQPPSAFRGS